MLSSYPFINHYYFTLLSNTSVLRIVPNFLQEILDTINVLNPTPEDYDRARAFICRLYKSPLNDLDGLRVRTILSTNKAEENPPTMNTAYFHCSRSFCQASRLLYAHLPTHSNLPSPLDYGGYTLEDNEYVPIMTTLEPMPDVMQEDISCDCKGECLTKRCKCRKVPMRCTLLCHKSMKYNSDCCQNKPQ